MTCSFALVCRYRRIGVLRPVNSPCYTLERNRCAKKELRIMLAFQQKARILHWTSIPSQRGDCIVMATEAGVCWAGTPGTAIDDGQNGRGTREGEQLDV